MEKKDKIRNLINNKAVTVVTSTEVQGCKKILDQSQYHNNCKSFFTKSLDGYFQQSKINIQNYLKVVYKIFQNIGIENMKYLANNLTSKNTDNLNQLDNLMNSTMNNIKDESKKSISFSFEFDKWNTFIPYDIISNTIPENNFFKSIKAENYIEIIEYYTNNHFKKRNFQEKIPTFQNEQVISHVCMTAEKYWKILPKHIKLACWLLIIGYNDNISEPDIKYTLSEETDCEEFINQELTEKRIIQMHKQIYKRYMASKYFKIETEKFLPDGTKYLKKRYVCNMVKVNSILPECATQLKYNFPNCEFLFSDYNIYTRLMDSNYYSVLDKVDFYRQIHSIPNATNIIKFQNKSYLDLRVKQGHRYASAVAQAISHLIDHTFNQENLNIYTCSIQDDSIFLHQQKNTIKTQIITVEKLYNHNLKFGFKCNKLKTQFMQKSCTWCGYTLNAKTKMLKVPDKKISELEELAYNLLYEKKNSRRMYAKYLGKIYAYRLIGYGLAISLASLTIKTRRYIFKNTSNFYNELHTLLFFKSQIIDKYQEFFDEELDNNFIELADEFKFTLSLIKRNVTYQNIRKNIFTLNTLNPLLSYETINKLTSRIYTDASLTGYGIIAFTGNEWYAINFTFSLDCILMKQPINTKELFALVIAMLFASFLDDYNQINNSTSNWILFIDNECSKQIAISRKAKLHSHIICNLAESINKLQLAINPQFYYARITSDMNKLADILSRKNVGSYVNTNFSYLMGLKINEVCRKICNIQYFSNSICSQSSRRSTSGQKLAQNTKNDVSK